MHATPELLARVPSRISEPRRRKLVAMTLGLDDAIGTVTAALRKHKLEQNTLLFFVNDNGGARTTASSNQPLRGRKGSPFEGFLDTIVLHNVGRQRRRSCWVAAHPAS